MANATTKNLNKRSNKRLGANARINIESQRQRNKAIRGDTLKKVGSFWKVFLIITLIVSFSAVLGYGLNRSQWMQNYKAEKNRYKVEWASLADQLWDKWTFEQQVEERVVAAIYQDNQWKQLLSDATVKDWQGALYKIPVVHVSDQMRLDELSAFLKRLEMEYPELYKRLSEINLRNNDIEVVVEGITPRILLRIDRKPHEHLNTVEKFVKKFPAEVAKALKLDARFEGFIYASKDDK